MTDALPPAAQVMQMLTGAWLSQTISAVTRLDVPELIAKHGPLSARELTAHGVDADPERLQRALRGGVARPLRRGGASCRFRDARQSALGPEHHRGRPSPVIATRPG